MDETLDHNSCIFVHDLFVLEDVRVNFNKLISWLFLFKNIYIYIYVYIYIYLKHKIYI